METKIAAAGKKGVRSRVPIAQNCPPSMVHVCKVDGSWKPPRRGRIGFVVEEGNELKGYRAAPSKVSCPMQAEEVALRDAVLFVKGLQIQSCTFYTDNQRLANLCSALYPLLEADWQAYKEINEVWGLIQENDYVCKHVYRSENVMVDHFAKVGSLLDDGYTGFLYPTFSI